MMIRRPAHLALLLVSFLLPLAASPAAASVAPTSLALGGALGLGLGAGGHGTFDGMAPLLQTGWRLGSRVSLRSDIAYLRNQSPAPAVPLVGLASTGSLGDRLLVEATSDPGADRYLPLGVGLRLYLRQKPAGSGQGPFIEAMPTLSVAWLPLPYGYRGDDVRVLRGVKGAIGARFAAMDGTRGEIGLAYYSMERATTAVDYRNFSPGIHAARDFRFDAVALYVTLGFGD